MPSRRIRAILALLILALIISTAIYSFGKPRRLNVILVTFDTTRADHLGIYGYQQGLTSSFDDFANQGLVFDRAYAPAPITLPSHATMLTGLYPPEHGLRVNGSGRLEDDIPLLPQILKQHGYDTGAFIAAFVLDSMFGLDRGFDTYDDDLSKGTRSTEFDELRRDAEEIVNSATAWIAGRNSRPFFCWIHLYDAHGPYDMRTGLFDNRFEQNPYDAGIAVEVQQFGRLIEFLKKSKLDKNTLVVVAGDHGEGLHEHMESDHGMLVYNTTLHVPLVFAGPCIGQPGSRVAEVVSLVDMMPTVLDVLHIPPPKHVSGRSLVEAFNGKPIISTPCYAETETPYDQNRWCPLRTVISDRWKFIESVRPELYDLQNDHAEVTNLIESAMDERQQMQNVLELMQEKFDQHGAQHVKLSEKQQAILETLGYVATDNFNWDAKGLTSRSLPDVKDMLPYMAKYDEARRIGWQGKFKDAIALLKELIQERNDYLGAYLLLGDCLKQERRFDEAIEIYRSARDLVPSSVRVRMILADSLIARGWYMDAESEFREIVKLDPESAPPHFQLGEILYALQQFDDAIAEFRESIKISPGFTAANVRLGEVLTRIERFDEAAACYQQAIELDPKNTAARTAFATLLLRTGKNDQALQQARKAVEIDPASFDCHVQLGTVFASLNRHREAIVQFHEAQRLRPDDPGLSQLIQQTEDALGQRGK